MVRKSKANEPEGIFVKRTTWSEAKKMIADINPEFAEYIRITRVNKPDFLTQFIKSKSRSFITHQSDGTETVWNANNVGDITQITMN